MTPFDHDRSARGPVRSVAGLDAALHLVLDLDRRVPPC